jgi:predicted dehydrogenase
MNNGSHSIRFGLTGLGGYAGYVCDRLLDESDAADGSSSAKLIAVEEPEPERFPRRVLELTNRGIPVLRDFAELLALDIEAVWLPLPIHLHLPYTEAALKAGKGVICEKPAAGCVDDVDRMIAARDQSGLPVAIGFQDVFQPPVAKLKKRLIAGEFGKPLSAQVIGCWPRSERYFGRNDWAGRIRRDGRWVMDSPASNALAHFLHLALFLLGTSHESSAHPSEVSAELYRANPIENYDTCAMRFVVDPGRIPLDVAYTHACGTSLEPLVVIETEKAKILYVTNRHVEIRVGATEEILLLSPNPHKHMLASFAASLRDGGNGVASTLEMARAHIVAVNAASEAAPVIDVAPQYISAIPAADQSVLRAIQDVIPALKSCISSRCHLHETGLAPWATRPAARSINGYTHFAGPATTPPPGAVEAKTFVSSEHPAATAKA